MPRSVRRAFAPLLLRLFPRRKSRWEALGVPELSFSEVEDYVVDLYRGRNRIPPNGPDWGLAGEKLPEAWLPCYQSGRADGEGVALGVKLGVRGWVGVLLGSGGRRSGPLHRRTARYTLPTANALRNTLRDKPLGMTGGAARISDRSTRSRSAEELPRVAARTRAARRPPPRG